MIKNEKCHVTISFTLFVVLTKIPSTVQQNHPMLGFDHFSGHAEGCDQISPVLFPMVGLPDQRQNGHDEVFDTGLIGTAQDAEVPFLTPLRAPAVRHSLKKAI